MSATDDSNSAAFVPNETERKKILFWLKQVSSYTTWNRSLSFYQE
ncbi:Imm71 family immunity protein [Cupriavidus alkaliphilus]